MVALQLDSATWNELSAEAVQHLQILLRFDTTNPPGNEGPAINYIREQLVEAGVSVEIVEPAPGRPSLYARLAGKGSKRPLILLSHVDVVPVEREHWTVDPFGGEIHQGYIYGRGAVDMKSMTAKQLALLLHFARRKAAGETLSRDIIMLAVADEECSGTLGMGWIVKNRPDLLDAEYVINEGGGYTVEFGGTRFYLCETGQKGIGQVTLHAKGDPGHASIPHRNNAVAKLARALHCVARAPLPLHATATMRTCLTELAAPQSQPLRTLIPQILNPLLSENILRLLPNQSIANALRATLHNTATPTILAAGKALNVIPSEATAQLDGRLIPGQTGEAFARELRQRIGDPTIDIEVDFLSPGHESTAQTELFTAISTVIAEHDPGAKVIPYLFPAVSDSRFLVPLGIIAYGFDPMKPEPGWPQPQQMAHSHDERISVANIGFGLQVLHDAISKICQ